MIGLPLPLNLHSFDYEKYWFVLFSGLITEKVKNSISYIEKCQVFFCLVFYVNQNCQQRIYLMGVLVRTEIQYTVNE